MVEFSDYRAKHVTKVLKASVGDLLCAGVVGGEIGEARIVAVTSSYPFHVKAELKLSRKPPDKCPLDFVIALPRPVMLRRIISQATSLGVENMHIIHSNKVEKSYWNSGAMDDESITQNVLHGLEQAIDTIPPTITFHRKFKPFIEDFFPSIAQQYSTLLVAHPNESNSLKGDFTDAPGKILVAVGPEGGWVDFEITKFSDAGFYSFSVGKRILRVDTAVINIHGILMNAVTI